MCNTGRNPMKCIKRVSEVRYLMEEQDHLPDEPDGIRVRCRVGTRDKQKSLVSDNA
jgi:hypothetical protein